MVLWKGTLLIGIRSSLVASGIISWSISAPTTKGVPSTTLRQAHKLKAETSPSCSICYSAPPASSSGWLDFSLRAQWIDYTTAHSSTHCSLAPLVYIEVLLSELTVDLVVKSQRRTSAVAEACKNSGKHEK